MVSITLRIKSNDIDVLPMFTTEDEVSYLGVISSLEKIKSNLQRVVKSVAQDGV